MYGKDLPLKSQVVIHPGTSGTGRYTGTQGPGHINDWSQTP